MSLGCYYYFDEYPFSSTEDLYGKYKNISGPPIYDTYGEDVMIVEPIDFVFREDANEFKKTLILCILRLNKIFVIILVFWVFSESTDL